MREGKEETQEILWRRDNVEERDNVGGEENGGDNVEGDGGEEKKKEKEDEARETLLRLKHMCGGMGTLLKEISAKEYCSRFSLHRGLVKSNKYTNNYLLHTHQGRRGGGGGGGGSVHTARVITTREAPFT